MSRRLWLAPLIGLLVFYLAAHAVAALSDAKMVLLWTDVLVFVLVFAALGFALEARHKEHLRAPWRYVAQQPLAMSALVVLIFYLLVGLIDSIHFRQALEQEQQGQQTHYSGEMLSVLDIVTGTLRANQEKTYSAPFSIYLFSKESIESNGETQRDYPRLRHAGAHLENPADKAGDIVASSLVGIIEAVLIILLTTVLLLRTLARRNACSFNVAYHRLLKGEYRIPWRSILFSYALIVLVLMVAINLSGKYHIFGTDKVGQDVFYLSLKSIRTGLVIGTLTTLIMLPFAVLLGISAGYFRGWVDDVIQYLYTTLNSIPSLLLIAAAILSLQVYMANNPDMFETITERADIRLLFLCIILGITSWTGLCRLLRGETFKLSEMDYIQAAQAFGVNRMTIIGRHILPNVMHIVLITVVLDFSGLVLAEAVLSYVGIGVDPIMVSWGNMINSARLEMARDPVVWWSLVAAFIMMFILVLAANLFSDAVRDAFDPRVNRSR